MALYKTIQTSFLGGEISDRMLTRVDLATYTRSAKTLENVYPFTHGGVTRRSGTMFLSEVFDSASDVKLIPFIYSEDDTFMLVFNGGYMEVIKNKQIVETSPGVPYKLSIPYSASDFKDLRYAQSGNVMFITHPNYPPKQLVRNADDNWSLTDLQFLYRAVSDSPFENGYISFEIVTVSDGHEIDDYYEIVVDGTGNTTVGGPFRPGSPGATPNGSLVGATANPNNIFATTWTITCVSKTELREEWSVSETGGLSPAAQWYSGNYPNTVSFYEQRLYFGGAPAYPQRIWGSKAGDYTNFTQGPEDNDGLQFTIASNRFDKITHLESARQLLPLTVGSEFSMSGATGVGITPSAVAIRAHTFHGSKYVKPLRIGQEVLFVQRDGKKVRAISYDITLDANVAPDITILSEHITQEGNGIVDWAFAQDPDFIIWLIRDDGALLSLTHMREQEVTAWAKHSTTNGKFLQAETIPEGNSDTVYFIIEREIDGQTRKYIEYFHPGTNVDCHLHGSSGTPTDTWSGLEHLEGEEVAIVADGRVHPNRTVSGGQITLQREVSDVIIGLPYISTVELLHPEVPLSDGTSQGRQMKIKEVVLRLKDTVGVNVNDSPQPVIVLPDTFDTPPTPFTGEKDVYVQGWKFPNNIKIEQTLPMPFTLLGAVLKLEVND